MTHFSRRFKATYGVLPSEYRSMLKLERKPADAALNT